MNTRKLMRRLRYHVKSIVDRRCPAPLPGVEIDVVIPVTRKDLAVLPLALEGIRSCVAHRVAAIYVVAAPEREIMDFCRVNGLEFVDERSVLGYGPESLGMTAGTPPRDRSGWIFQQLLKLSGSVGRSPYFVTVDADHVMLRPHTFVAADGRLCFYQSKEYHPPYYDGMRRLIGLEPDSSLSYVAHKMVFDRALLASLRDAIELCHPGMRWDEAIVTSVDRAEVSGFSEFELYGNYVPAGRKCRLPFRNHHLPASAVRDYRELVRRYGFRCRAVTFPDYLK